MAARPRPRTPPLAARFHEQVIELAGNRTLTLVGLILMEIVEPHNRATFAAIERGEAVAEHAQEDHAALLDALADGRRRGGSGDLGDGTCGGAMDTSLAALGASTRIDLLEMSS